MLKFSPAAHQKNYIYDSAENKIFKIFKNYIYAHAYIYGSAPLYSKFFETSLEDFDA